MTKATLPHSCNRPLRRLISDSARAGFTLVELLVVMSIVGILIAMLMPAVQHSREMARRARCESHLLTIGTAFDDYRNAHESFPSGTTDTTDPIRSVASGLHHSWIIPLLDYLDEPVAASKIQPDVSVYDPQLAQVRKLQISCLICPTSQPDSGPNPASNYAGVHHSEESPISESNNGTLFLNSQISTDQLTDGLHYTMVVGEKLVSPSDLGWMSGTSATLRNTGSPITREVVESTDPLDVGGFASSHPIGCQFLFADTSCRLISCQIDMTVFQQLSNRHDGQQVHLDEL